MRVEYIDNKKILNFGYCVVVEESNKFYGIYRNGKILSHCDKWRKATKVAQLLSDAYKLGSEEGYEEVRYDTY